MKKILNPYLNKKGYNCVCCAPNNPVGLHLEFWEEGEDVLTIWNPGENCNVPIAYSMSAE